MTRDTRLRREPDVSSLDLHACPECGSFAEVEWRDVVDSTDGPVEMVKIRCLHRHWFLLPVETLRRSGGAPPMQE